jgi:hypothetical protein
MRGDFSTRMQRWLPTIEAAILSCTSAIRLSTVAAVGVRVMLSRPAFVKLALKRIDGRHSLQTPMN